MDAKQNMRESTSATVTITSQGKPDLLAPVSLDDPRHFLLGDIPESNAVGPLKIRFALHGEGSLLALLSLCQRVLERVELFVETLDLLNNKSKWSDWSRAMTVQSLHDSRTHAVQSMGNRVARLQQQIPTLNSYLEVLQGLACRRLSSKQSLKGRALGLVLVLFILLVTSQKHG